ncbi:SanA/YdcF family protein [Flavisolibacter tropicus]|uniref:Protein SanA n=1 Tax=Flavisolibacter tropicus TaxID=1492898 RepID=A0A172U3C1_9BACT|nr:ElyC/SanA/YdcF family protein [Flavisolibacter tropicus]ANE53533.1 protein SanA [Flavisolibacter tropicus]
MNYRKLLLYLFVIVIIISLVAVVYCNWAVNKAAEGKLFRQVKEVPFNKVGLLLGTSKFLEGGRANLYYQYRIQAALELYKAGKVQYIIVSGDNSREDYNEPELMRNDLVQGGIDSNHIVLDYAGFRTFDSIVRLREIFGQSKVTIISQQFHNERALYIASKEGITAVAYNAKDVTTAAGFKTRLRERLARVKVFVDYLTNKQPKYLGPKIIIP